ARPWFSFLFSESLLDIRSVVRFGLRCPTSGCLIRMAGAHSPYSAATRSSLSRSTLAISSVSAAVALVTGTGPIAPIRDGGAIGRHPPPPAHLHRHTPRSGRTILGS